MEQLNDREVRVLGSLIEKEVTTPDNYPLSLNSLLLACNQSSNRTPVVQYDLETVTAAAESLREKRLVHLIDRGDSRVIKYRHVLYEAEDLGRPAVAVMTILMLRGPQTSGEIRTRSNRLYDFTSLEHVESTIEALIAREPAVVVRLPRQPGQKEVRYGHLLSGEITTIEPEIELEIEREAAEDRIGKLEREVEDLKKQFEQFRRQFE